MTKPSYIIGTGWWCNDTQTRDRETFGDDFIRGQDFHELWYRSVNKFTSPEKILIVDSNSPIAVPANKDDNRIEVLRLNTNAGHSTNHQGQICGWTRSALLGMQYTLMCDSDYFVYIEQDALLYGDGIVENCIAGMKKNYLFGNGLGTPQKLQQSFFIIRRKAIEKFVHSYLNISFPDSRVGPEDKFHLSAMKFRPWLSETIVANKNSNLIMKILDRAIISNLGDYDVLDIGYGRSRPINFKDQFFYFQHGSKQELEEYLRVTKT